MLDDILDRLIGRLIAAAALVVASAIAAVSAAMAVFAFLSQAMGATLAHVVVASGAALVVTVWSLLHSHQRKRRKAATFEQRAAIWIGEHSSAAFAAGLAAGTFLKGQSSLAKTLWRARKGGR